MKKEMWIVFALIAIIVVSAVAPTLAENEQFEIEKVQPAPDTEYVYAQGGYVVLNLPPGGACNKTNIRIGVTHVDKQSTKGSEDYLEVRLWVPSKSSFIAIAIINDNQVAVDSIRKVFAGIPYVVAILVEDSVIDVWRNGDTITANLTKPVDIRFGNPLPPNSMYRELNFTLPPMTLKLVRTGEVVEKTESSSSFPSGWKRTQTEWFAPSWASVTIPAWAGNAAIPTAGILYLKQNSVYTPPPA